MRTLIGAKSEHATSGDAECRLPSVQTLVQRAASEHAELFAICDPNLYHVVDLVDAKADTDVEVAIGCEHVLASGARIWCVARSALAIKALFAYHNALIVPDAPSHAAALAGLANTGTVVILHAEDQRTWQSESEVLQDALGDDWWTTAEWSGWVHLAATDPDGLIREAPFAERMLAEPFELPKVERDHQADMNELKRRVENALAHATPPRDAYARDEHRRQRIEKELERIEAKNAAGMFIQAHDVVRIARNEAIPIGPGRGSAVASAVAYVLGLTDVDPMRYGLLFERFLPATGNKTADIDIDVSQQGRSTLLRRMAEQAEGTVIAGIGTRERWTYKSYVLTQPWARHVDEADKRHLIEHAAVRMEQGAEPETIAAELLPNTPDGMRGPLTDTLRRAAEHCNHLRMWKAHPDSIVQVPRGHVVPLVRTTDALGWRVATDRPEVFGLQKIDVLSSKVVDLLAKMRADASPSMKEIDYEDRAVYAALSAGKLPHVFQLKSEYAKQVLAEVRPDNFEELVACQALLRPQASEMRAHYVARKRGTEVVRYVSNKVKPILEDTYGLLLYQEQFLRVAYEFARMPVGEAEDYRRAVERQDARGIADHHSRFVAYAKERCGERDELAERVARMLETTGGYGFSRAHAVAYSHLSYECAWWATKEPTLWLRHLLAYVDSFAERKALEEMAKNSMHVGGGGQMSAVEGRRAAAEHVVGDWSGRSRSQRDATHAIAAGDAAPSDAEADIHDGTETEAMPVSPLLRYG